MHTFNGTASSFDFVLSGFRYTLLKSSGAVAATALTTAFAHTATALLEAPQATLALLIELAQDDVRMGRAMKVLGKSFTVQEALECMDSGALQAQEAAILATELATELMRSCAQGAAIENDVDFFALRRVLGALLQRVSAQSILDGVACLSGSRRADGIVEIIVPSPKECGSGDSDDYGFLGFFEARRGEAWTQQSYRSLIVSAVLTAARHMGIGIEEILEQMAGIKDDGPSPVAFSWKEMPSGLPDSVPAIVTHARRLARLIINGAMTSSLTPATFIAGFINSFFGAELGGILEARWPLWSGELPAKIATDRLILVLEGAPAVVV
jgi:hypothetical protein